MDIAPTVLDACGLTIPAQMQGQSLLPYMRADRPSLDRHYSFVSFVEAAGYQGVSYGMPHIMMGIRPPSHKYGIEVEVDDRALRNNRAVFHDLRSNTCEA